MKQFTLILVDGDARYRGKFLDYLMRRDHFPMLCRGCGDPEKAREMAGKEPAPLVLFGEEIWCGLTPEEKGRFRAECVGVGLLTEEHPAGTDPGEALSEGENCGESGEWPELFLLYRYQAMPQLMNRILGWKESLESEVDPVPGGRTRCAAFLAPAGCGLLPTLALGAGRLLAGESRVLLLDFSDFSVLARTPAEDVTTGRMSESLSGAERRSLSDLLYLQASGNTWHLAELLGRMGELEWLMPVVSPEDVWNLPGEEMAKILSDCAAREEYDWILVLPGSGRDPLPLLKECQRIFLLEEASPGSRRGTEHFLSWLRQKKAEPVMERCRRIVVPAFPNLRDLVPEDDNLRFSPLGEWIAGEMTAWFA